LSGPDGINILATNDEKATNPLQREEQMRYLRKPYSWPLLSAVLTLCVLLGLTSGCSRFGKKEKAEFKPGSAWLEDMQARVEENKDKRIILQGHRGHRRIC
jgi:hypothetical protein